MSDLTVPACPDPDIDVWAADQALMETSQQLARQGYQFITVTPLTHQRVLSRPHDPSASTWRDLLGWNRPLLWPLSAHHALGVEAGENLTKLIRAGWLQIGLDQCLHSQVRLSSLPLLTTAQTLSQQPPSPGRSSLLLAHSGYPTVAEQAVFFGPDTYRFVHALAASCQTRAQPIRRALEVCAGAAPAALALQALYPEAEVWATDINPQALRMARLNAGINALPIRVQASDLYLQLAGQFDLIVANPPYLVDPHSRTYRHGGSQWGAELAVRIVAEGWPRLQPGGELMLYTGVAIIEGEDVLWQALQPVLQPLRAQGWTIDYQMLDPDVFGEELELPAYQQVERIAAVVLRLAAPWADGADKLGAGASMTA